MSLDPYPKQGAVLPLQLGPRVERFRVRRGNPGRLRMEPLSPGVMIPVGVVFPIPGILDDGAPGTRYWKVEKSNPVRTYLVPCSSAEIRRALGAEATREEVAGATEAGVELPGVADAAASFGAGVAAQGVYFVRRAQCGCVVLTLAQHTHNGAVDGQYEAGIAATLDAISRAGLLVERQENPPPGLLMCPPMSIYWRPGDKAPDQCGPSPAEGALRVASHFEALSAWLKSWPRIWRTR